MVIRRGAARGLVVALVAATPLLVLSGCSSDEEEASDSADTAEDSVAEDTDEEAAADEAVEEGDDTDTADSAGSDDFCVAVEALEESLFLMDADSVEELDALFADVEAAYDAVQEAAGDEYSEALDAFEQAMDEFEAVLETEGADVRGVIDAAADLGLAGEVLAEEVDCATV